MPWLHRLFKKNKKEIHLWTLLINHLYITRFPLHTHTRYIGANPSMGTQMTLNNYNWEVLGKHPLQKKTSSSGSLFKFNYLKINPKVHTKVPWKCLKTADMECQKELAQVGWRYYWCCSQHNLISYKQRWTFSRTHINPFLSVLLDSRYKI